MSAMSPAVIEQQPLVKSTHKLNHSNANYRSKRKCWLVLICAVFMAGSMFCVYLVSISPEFNQYRLLRSYQNGNKLEITRPRSILFWTGFFHHKRWGFAEDTMGPTYFRDVFRCPIYQCELTNVHDFLPSVDMYDAVLFHTAEPFPIFNSVPSRRSPRQLYVFALMEPPGETKHVLSDEGGFYNLTMTYRLDSDIIWLYQSIFDIDSGMQVAPAKFPAWRQPPTQWNDETIRELWPIKNKTAAWFVSHCETLSQRENLAATLQKYIDVDIYGKCGTKSCAYKAQECDDMLDREYKFYFSFENALCHDYVTEKLYNALKRHVVPVVFGGANYTRFLPPHSYINAEDFESAHDLAFHLKYLSTHLEEYMKYFWWRQFYRLGYSSPFCDLCEKLHSPTHTHKTQIYQDIEKWWLEKQCRFEAKIKF